MMRRINTLAAPSPNVRYTPPTEEAAADPLAELARLFATSHELLRGILAALQAHAPKQPHQEYIVLQASTPNILRTFGRRHTRIYVASATAITIEDISDTITLTTGWNVLDLREGTRITGPAVPVNAIFEATDYDVL